MKTSPLWLLCHRVQWFGYAHDTLVPVVSGKTVMPVKPEYTVNVLRVIIQSIVVNVRSLIVAAASDPSVSSNRLVKAGGDPHPQSLIRAVFCALPHTGELAHVQSIGEINADSHGSYRRRIALARCDIVRRCGEVVFRATVTVLYDARQQD